jgi:hypothetical protein
MPEKQKSEFSMFLQMMETLWWVLNPMVYNKLKEVEKSHFSKFTNLNKKYTHNLFFFFIRIDKYKKSVQDLQINKSPLL